MSELKKIKSLPLVGSLVALATSTVLLGEVAQADPGYHSHPHPKGENYRILDGYNRHPQPQLNIPACAVKIPTLKLEHGFTADRTRSFESDCNTTEYSLKVMGQDYYGNNVRVPVSNLMVFSGTNINKVTYRPIISNFSHPKVVITNVAIFEKSTGRSITQNRLDNPIVLNPYDNYTIPNVKVESGQYLNINFKLEY